MGGPMLVTKLLEVCACPERGNLKVGLPPWRKKKNQNGGWTICEIGFVLLLFSEGRQFGCFFNCAH